MTAGMPAGLDAMMDSALREGIVLMKTPAADDPGAPGCWLGGQPTLPPGIDWPWYDQGPRARAPMHFLAQINLTALPRSDAHPDLPRRGTLFFFYDTIFAPIYTLGVVGARVIHVAEDVGDHPPRQMPDLPSFPADQGPPDTSFWWADAPTMGYRRWNVEPVLAEWYDTNAHPDPAFQDEAHEANVDTFMRLQNEANALRPADRQPLRLHMMFGAQSYQSQPKGMIRLLTLDSDPDLALFHGDDRSLVFWIAPEDLKAGRFDRAPLYEE